MTILTALGAILAIVLLDMLLGVILSIRAGTFDVRRLPQFLATNVFPFVGGLCVLGAATLFAGDYSMQIAAIFYAAVAATIAKFIAEIKDKVIQIFGQIEMLEDAPINLNDTLIIEIKKAIIEIMEKKTTG